MDLSQLDAESFILLLAEALAAAGAGGGRAGRRHSSLVRGRPAGSATVNSQAWQELARIEANSEHENFQGTVLTSAVKLSNPNQTPLAGTPRIVIKVDIGGGNVAGNATVTQYTLAGKPLAFSGSSVRVSAKLAPNELADLSAATGTDGATLPANVTANVTCVIALGRSDAPQATQWIVPAEPLQSFQLVQLGPGQLHQVQGFNHGANVEYLMFFDAVGLPANGTAPLWTIPLAGLPSSPACDDVFSNDFIVSNRIFQLGLVWAASTTADTLTYDNTAVIRVDIELSAQQVPGGGTE